jgi:hypothetical protein
MPWQLAHLDLNVLEPEDSALITLLLELLLLELLLLLLELLLLLLELLLLLLELLAQLELLLLQPLLFSHHNLRIRVLLLLQNRR